MALTGSFTQEPPSVVTQAFTAKVNLYETNKTNARYTVAPALINTNTGEQTIFRDRLLFMTEGEEQIEPFTIVSVDEIDIQDGQYDFTILWDSGFELDTPQSLVNKSIEWQVNSPPDNGRTSPDNGGNGGNGDNGGNGGDGGDGFDPNLPDDSGVPLLPVVVALGAGAYILTQR